MPGYSRLTEDQRIELHVLKKAGLNQKAIATQLEVSPSSISRELKRTTGLRGVSPEAGAPSGLRAQGSGGQ